MNTILQKRIEEAVKKTACPQCVFNDGGTCNNDDDCKLFDDFVGLMTFALQNQWVSVGEALPNYEEDVLVTNDVGDYWFSHRTENENVMQDENNFASVNGIFKITHWMPIPQIEGGKK